MTSFGQFGGRTVIQKGSLVEKKVSFFMLTQHIHQMIFLIQGLNPYSGETEIFPHLYLMLEALVNQDLMPLPTELHFIRVQADQRVEEGVELIIGIIFWPHYPPHSLDLLPSRLEVHTDLDAYIRTGQINSCIAHAT